MFCNTPGNGAEDHALLNTIVADEVVSEGQNSDLAQDNEIEAVLSDRCSAGYCETNWKPRKEVSA